MLSQAYYVIIYRGVIAPGHGIKVVDGINDTRKQFLLQLMKTVKLPGSKGYEIQMVMQFATYTADVRLV